MSEVVVSVPHSGTRMLRDHLGLPTLYHFSSGARFEDSPEIEVVNVPIRNPYEVAISWARRHKPIDQMVENFRAMFGFFKGDLERVKIWKVEDFSVKTFYNETFSYPGKEWTAKDHLDAVQEVLARHWEFYLPFNYRF